MELYNMNFREFIDEDKKPHIQNHKTMPKQIVDEDEEYDLNEEYQEPVRNTVKRVQQDIDDDYDVDDVEEEYYEEPVRQPVQQIKRPMVQHKPMPQYRVIQRPIQRPKYTPGYALPDDQFRRPLAVSPKQLKESTIEGTANTLTEAIKRKVDTVFYRFGIQGLEKLDEKILDTIEELQYPESKQIKKPLKEMRRIPGKKIIKKVRPLPLEEIKPVPQYEEPIYDEPEEIEQNIVDEQIIEEPIEQINEEPVEKQIKPLRISPKPKFMQPAETSKPNKEIIQTGDVDEDIMNAALTMDFGPENKNENLNTVSDDDVWNTVEAILETKPQQELVHEPQTQSVLPVNPIEKESTSNDVNSDENDIEEQTEQIVEKPKQKHKRKSKVEMTETNEESNTNEEEEK